MKIPLPVARAWCNVLHRGRYRRYMLGDDVVIMCRRCKRRMLMVNGEITEDNYVSELDDGLVRGSLQERRLHESRLQESHLEDRHSGTLGAKPSGAGQSGAELSGTEPSGAEQSGTEQSGAPRVIDDDMPFEDG